MSRKGKRILKLLGILYFIAFIAFLLTFSRLGFHRYTRPRLIPTQIEIPRREGHASDEALAAAKAEIVKAGYRLRGPNAGLESDTLVGVQEIATLIEKSGPPTVPVRDPRLIRQMAAKNLVAGEEFRHEGMILCPNGGALDEETLTALALAYDNLEGEGRHDRIMVKGSGSIVGFDLTLVFAGLNFLVLVAFLYAVLWEPVTRMLDERARAVRSDIDSANARREEAERLREEASAELERIRDGAEEVREAGRRKGEAERTEIVKEARDEARRTAERTKRAVEAEIDRARAAAAGDLGGLSLDLASMVIGRAVTPEDHERLVREFIDALEHAPGAEGGGA